MSTETAPKTHRERAERTADLWLNSDNRGEPLATIIAQETYPTELVEALGSVLRDMGLHRDQGIEDEDLGDGSWMQARAALALYEERP